MAIIKSIPSQRIIYGRVLNTSEVSIVSETDYRTQGENCIVVKDIPFSTITLDSKTTDHTVIKALTKIIIKPDIGKVDEEFDEIEVDRGACIEFRFCGNSWYILSSDGLKQS